MLGECFTTPYTQTLNSSVINQEKVYIEKRELFTLKNILHSEWPELHRALVSLSGIW